MSVPSDWLGRHPFTELLCTLLKEKPILLANKINTRRGNRGGQLSRSTRLERSALPNAVQHELHWIDRQF